MKLASFSLLAPMLIKGIFACEDLFETPQEVLQALLPPVLPFDDSEYHHLIITDGDFVTPVEASNFTETPSYEEILQFYSDLAASSANVDLQNLYTFPSGEAIVLIIVSGEKAFKAEDMTKPIVYMTAGIHAGESMGVSAGMMFIRNLVTMEIYSQVLENVNFLFVPLFNVQGYLRQSANGRINQHGPNTSGRRANGSWNNHNRDFGKLDTPEVRTIVKVMNDYDVSFYADLHSTDGMMYQADVEYCDNGDSGLSPSIFKWLREEMKPDLDRFLESYNHKTSVCIDANDPMDPTAGYYPYFTDGPAYSTNYADHRHIPAYLLEIHAPKPFKQRVLGAYSWIGGILKIVGEKADSLREAIDTDRNSRISPVPIAWDYVTPAPIVDFDIYNYSIKKNDILGIDQIIYTDEPITIQVEQSDRTVPLDPPDRPYAYVIPAAWNEVIERLSLHGIQMEIFAEDTEMEVTNYRIEDFEVGGNREGRSPSSGTLIKEVCTRTYTKNDVFLRTDQPLSTLAVALLEPTGESSFFYWGFFNSKMATHEYPENYIMVPLAERMLNESETIRVEWEEYKALIGNDTSGVLDWFFRRSAFYDTEAYVLDIGLLYEAPASGEENLEPYASTGDKKPTCVTSSIQEVASKVNKTVIEEDVAEKVNSPNNSTSGAHVIVKGSFAVAAVALHFALLQL